MKGIELRKLRKKIGYNQEELAFVLEVTKTTIVNWEKKERLSDKAERLVKDYFMQKNNSIEGDFNQIGNNNQNFLHEPQEKYSKKNSELELENQRLIKELLECRSQLIKALSDKN